MGVFYNSYSWYRILSSSDYRIKTNIKIQKIKNKKSVKQEFQSQKKGNK